jgi:hypothetical protein
MLEVRRPALLAVPGLEHGASHSWSPSGQSFLAILAVSWPTGATVNSSLAAAGPKPIDRRASGIK